MCTYILYYSVSVSPVQQFLRWLTWQWHQSDLKQATLLSFWSLSGLVNVVRAPCSRSLAFHQYIIMCDIPSFKFLFCKICKWLQLKVPGVKFIIILHDSVCIFLFSKHEDDYGGSTHQSSKISIQDKYINVNNVFFFLIKSV